MQEIDFSFNNFTGGMCTVDSDSLWELWHLAGHLWCWLFSIVSGALLLISLERCRHRRLDLPRNRQARGFQVRGWLQSTTPAPFGSVPNLDAGPFHHTVLAFVAWPLL